MAFQKREIEVKVYKGGNKVTKRRWTPKEYWDTNGIKDYILSEIQKKTLQKNILANLQNKGISMDRNQLQRLLKQASQKRRNLHQKHRKHIFDTENKLLEGGTAVKSWYFSDTNQRVKGSQLSRIRKSNGQEFKDVIASPGMLVFSPMEPMQDNASSDNGSTCHGPVVNSPTNPISISTSDEGDYIAGLGRMNLTSQAPGGVSSSDLAKWELDNAEPFIPHASKLQDETGTSDIYEARDSPLSESNELAEPEVDDCSPLDEPEETISELLESIFDDVVVYLDETGTLTVNGAIEDLSTMEIDHISHEQTSQILRPLLGGYLQKILKFARAFLNEVNSLEESTGWSTIRCERKVRNLAELRSGNAPFFERYMDSRTALELVEENGNSPSFIVKTDLDVEFEAAALAVFETYIIWLWKDVETQETDFLYRKGFIYPSTCHEELRGIIIHFPYLVRAYGIRHYFTMTSLATFLEMCTNYYGHGPEDLRQLLQIAISRGQVDYLSPFMVAFYEILTETYALRGLNDQTPFEELGIQIMKTTMDFFGDHSLSTVRILANVMSTAYGNGEFSEREIDTLNAFLIVKLRSVCPKDLSAPAFFTIFIVSANQRMISRPEYAIMSMRLFDNRFAAIDHRFMDPESTFLKYFKVVQWLKADAYRMLGHYSKSLSALHDGIYRFPDAFPSSRFTSELIESATRIMTERGLVRYSEPILERLLKVCEAQDNYEKNPFYHNLIFAAGSATFQRYLDHQEWHVSRVFMKGEELEWR